MKMTKFSDDFSLLKFITNPIKNIPCTPYRPKRRIVAALRRWRGAFPELFRLRSELFIGFSIRSSRGHHGVWVGRVGGSKTTHNNNKTTTGCVESAGSLTTSVLHARSYWFFIRRHVHVHISWYTWIFLYPPAWRQGGCTSYWLLYLT